VLFKNEDRKNFGSVGNKENLSLNPKETASFRFFSGTTVSSVSMHPPDEYRCYLIWGVVNARITAVRR
jgi:hypothetical protein